MSQPDRANLTRRAFFSTSGAAAICAGQAASARVAPGTDSDYVYEVQRSEDDWRAMLDETEFAILREGFTEKPKSSPLWNEERDGTYHCKGCALPVFDSRWKTTLEKGWVFFLHSKPDAVLTNIDGPTPDYGSMAESLKATMEIHCRRCGSHLGHFLVVEGLPRHCINGTALTFTPVAA